MAAHRLWRATAVALVLLASGACAGASTEHDFTIRVTGTPGTRVVGQYVLMTAGERLEKDLDETIPFSVDLIGTDVSCYLQKLGQDGTARIQLTMNGSAIAFNSTRARFGSVSAKTP